MQVSTDMTTLGLTGTWEIDPEHTVVEFSVLGQPPGRSRSGNVDRPEGLGADVEHPPRGRRHPGRGQGEDHVGRLGREAV